MATHPKALPYVFDAPLTQPVTAEKPARAAAPDTPLAGELLDMEVDNLELSIRSANCLQNANITYIGELVQMSAEDLLRTKNFGRKTLAELAELLAEMGLQFGTNVGGWRPPS